MAGSLKDALKKAGLTPAEKPPAKRKPGWAEELPDDETLPPRFDPPPLTSAVDPSLPPKQPGGRRPK